MLYDLSLGKGENVIVKRARENRAPIPIEILKQPILKDALLFYYEAFYELCSERNEQHVIPVTKIQSYAKFFNLGQIEYSRLFKFVNFLNSEAVEYELKKTRDANAKS